MDRLNTIINSHVITRSFFTKKMRGTKNGNTEVEANTVILPAGKWLNFHLISASLEAWVKADKSAKNNQFFMKKNSMTKYSM